MRIGILGWGSLIKEPRELLISGDWQKDGPVLWIEFYRISQSGVRADCLTLVIDENNGAEVRTLYAVSQHTELSRGIADLQIREGTSLANIGFYEVNSGDFAPNAQKRHPKSCERIRAWTSENGFDAVVWTALPPRFKDVLGIQFTPTAALNYLNELTESAKKDLVAFQETMSECEHPVSSLTLVDSNMIQARWNEALSVSLPILKHDLVLDSGKYLSLQVANYKTVLAAIKLSDVLKLPGVNDQTLFRKNVRQSLGLTNKINKGLKQTLTGDNSHFFFLYHNGITAICDKLHLIPCPKLFMADRRWPRRPAAGRL